MSQQAVNLRRETPINPSWGEVPPSWAEGFSPKNPATTHKRNRITLFLHTTRRDGGKLAT